MNSETFISALQTAPYFLKLTKSTLKGILPTFPTEIAYSKASNAPGPFNSKDTSISALQLFQGHQAPLKSELLEQREIFYHYWRLNNTQENPSHTIAALKEALNIVRKDTERSDGSSIPFHRSL